MADGMCDICGIRPATVQAEVVTNGRREDLELCDVDFRRLAHQQGSRHSPLESLFGSRGGSLFEDFFGNDLFGPRDGGGDRSGGSADGGGSVPIRRRATRARQVAGGAERLSAHAEEILQKAAHEAAEHGRREVDTEHLLLALCDSDVVRTILDQFKVSTDTLRSK